jgi:DNA-binding NarL/FixJ family response regulator
MPVISGLEVAPLLIKILPSVWLILFTAHDGPEVSRLARAAGIHAVVPKSEAAGILISQAAALVASALDKVPLLNNPGVTKA